ncbi:Ribonuclease HII/HIII domain [Phytophthora cactorum]|nr:Ribonuclease HII/HIII domain [Phytophthora cactorum]
MSDRLNLQRTVLLASDCPARCLNGAPVMLGIDEAADNDAMSALGFDDSKALSAESRAQLFEKMQSTRASGSWIVRLISAAEISDKMQRQTSNLNEISRDAAIQLINELQKKGAVVKKVFVDTVVSAASIAAKVTRDRVISDWMWESPSLDLPTDFGSGTKAWLATHVDRVFVFPNIIRFSWGTVEPFTEKAVKVEWPHEKELEKANAPTGTQSITSFLAKPVKKAKPATRAAFFTQRNMQDVTDF